MSNWVPFQEYVKAINNHELKLLEMTQSYHRARWLKYGDGFGFV